MNASDIERQFARIGARAELRPETRSALSRNVRIDIARNRAGEFFDIAVKGISDGDIQVIDSQPRLRHLLLMTRLADGHHKFLCGHDERHWFVAGVPTRINVTSVHGAFDALKPAAVQARVQQLKLKRSRRNRRRNEAFVRQGEWFFVPVPAGTVINERAIFRNEPISRSGGKPHLCEELVRAGGELVWISRKYPRGLSEARYRQLIQSQPKLAQIGWLQRRRNPQVFVRGKVRHPDHKTIVLDGWHEVLMNTENQSAAMAHVAFLD